jgi:hypothetical protein
MRGFNSLSAVGEYFSRVFTLIPSVSKYQHKKQYGCQLNSLYVHYTSSEYTIDVNVTVYPIVPAPLLYIYHIFPI